MVRKKRGPLRVSCADGTCIGAGSLLNAASLGCLKCIKKHIRDAGKQDKEGKTALMYAASWGMAEVIR